MAVDACAKRARWHDTIRRTRSIDRNRGCDAALSESSDWLSEQDERNGENFCEPLQAKRVRSPTVRESRQVGIAYARASDTPSMLAHSKLFAHLSVLKFRRANEESDQFRDISHRCAGRLRGLRIVTSRNCRWQIRWIPQ